MQTTPGTSLSELPSGRPRTRDRLLGVLVSVTVVVYVLDQLAKGLAVRDLRPGTSVPVLGSLLQLRLVRNAGAAFSVATGMTWLLTVVAVIVVLVVVRSARRLGSRGWALALGLLLGGALGNLTDRLVRPPGIGRGQVVDFIDYSGFFVGNVADIAIVTAAVLIGVLSLRGIGLDGGRAGDG